MLAFSFIVFFQVLFTLLFLFVCLILMLLVLLQKGRGGGLTGALGGGGGSSAFGSKTGDVLTWATSIIFGIFLLLAIVLNMLGNASNKAVAAEQPPVTITQQALTGGQTPPAEAHKPMEENENHIPVGYQSLTPPASNPLSPPAH